jgi:hypothetical protein
MHYMYKHRLISKEMLKPTFLQFCYLNKETVHLKCEMGDCAQKIFNDHQSPLLRLPQII